MVTSSSVSKSKKRTFEDKVETVVEKDAEEVEEESSSDSSNDSNSDDNDDEDDSAEVTAAAAAAEKKVKPLPPGYICKACGAKDDHAIYNCTNKISKKSKSATGASSSSNSNSNSTTTAKKPKTPALPSLYMSGLPFTTTKESLTSYLTEKGCLGIEKINIVKMDDNPSKCKGIAFIQVDNMKSAKLFKSLIDGETMEGSKKIISVVDTEVRNSNGTAVSVKSKTPRCYRCGEMHDPNECFNQRICYRCKSTEHLSSQCPKKKNY